MIRFAEPDEDSVFESLIDAFAMLKDVVSSEFHEQMKDMYVQVTHDTHSLYLSINLFSLPLTRKHTYSDYS